MENSVDLPRLKRMVQNATDLTQEARDFSIRDRDYYDGYQWTTEETATLRRRKQPIITINRVKRKVDAMVGIEQRGRTDPLAHPRNPGDEDAADIATKALRYVEEVERIDQKKSAAFENLLVEGYGGVEICAEERRGQMDVVVKRLRWEDIFYDPHSREKDFSDAAYIGVMKWMRLEAAREYARKFTDNPEALEAVEDTMSGQALESYDDRPTDEGFYWADKRMQRVRLASMYYQRDGVWRLSVFTGRGVLFDDVSPYLDEDGQPCCAIKLMSAYVDRENRRYGLVRDMISAQDEINKRRSKLLHQLNSRQTIGVKGAVDSVAAMKRELAAPDGHVDVNIEAFEDAGRVGMKPFEIVPQADQTAGQASLLQEAKGEIDMLGPNASLLGQLEGAQSGRAIMAQQQAGLAELSPIYDSLRDWTERVYRQVWAAIRQFWDGPRFIRVTEENEAPQFIGINQPVMAMTPMGPMPTGQVQNPVGQIDVDIIIDQAPEFATLRAEQFEKLAELAQSGVPIPPKVIIEASDLRDKRKLLEALEPPPELAQMQMQMQQRGAVAEVVGKEAKAAYDMARAQKTQAEIPGEQADTQRTVAETRQIMVEAALKPQELMFRSMRNSAAG